MLERQRLNLKGAERKRKSLEAKQQAALERQRRDLEEAEQKRKAEHAKRQAALGHQKRKFEEIERKRAVFQEDTTCARDAEAALREHQRGHVFEFDELDAALAILNKQEPSRRVNTALRAAIRRRTRRQRFSQAISNCYRTALDHSALVTPDTVICRCENVLLSRIRPILTEAASAPSLARLKSETRAGMGRCGGRNCIPTLVRLLSASTGCQCETITLPRARPPARPIRIRDLFSEQLPDPDLPADPHTPRAVNSQIKYEEIFNLLEMLGIDQYLKKQTMYLSLGEIKKLELTRLILEQKKLWILDEPYIGLDKNSMEIINETFIDHVSKNGIIIFSSNYEPDLKNLDIISLN